MARPRDETRSTMKERGDKTDEASEFKEAMAGTHHSYINSGLIAGS